mgnify:FL=1
MGLVQNLKKKFNNWVDRTLAELSSAYIKQLAKQTSKKRDNCSSMESLPSHLTTAHPSTIIATSSQDILEKITMKDSYDVGPASAFDTEDIVGSIRQWSIDRIDTGNLDWSEQQALAAEFKEWIEPEEGLEIMSLEPLEEEEG